MADTISQQISKTLRDGLQERDHNNSLLHHQAADLAAKGQLQPALRLLWSSIESAKRLNDDYVLGAARLHMAWAYFSAANQDEWDRAAELCEKATYHFQQAQVKHELGIAHLTRGCICEALCDKNQDRWTQGFRSFTDAFVLLRETSEEFAEYAREAYGRLGRKYVDLGLAQEAAAKAAETEAASASSAGAKTKTAETKTTADAKPGMAETKAKSGAPPGAEKPRADNARGSNGHVAAEQSAGERAANPPPPNSNSGAAPADAAPNAKTDSSAPGGAAANASEPSHSAPSEAKPSNQSDGAAQTDAAPDANPKTSAEQTTKPRRVTFGRALTRAVLERSFGFWAWVAFAGACILFGVILGLLTLAFQILWQSQTALMPLWIIGLGIGAAFFVIPFGLLAGARQLYIRLEENQAAVFVEHERVWMCHDKGVHPLIPFYQDVVAFVPTQVQAYANFKRNVIQWDTRWLSAHVEAAYQVAAPELFWDRVLSNLPRSRAFLLPRPLDVKTAQDALEKHAAKLMEQTLLRVAEDPQIRGLVANERALNDKIQERLRVDAPADGIEFQKIEFSIMLGMTDQAP